MNRLGDETSLYLKQHQNNPVDWRPWGDEAFDLAKKQGKPVLLSIGYAACHWCHVMAHESFEDPATASLINEKYIAIKVDREERPDIDGLYQHALSLMGLQGGWPLTMFLTPDRKPFWGGTYFPPTPRHGLPSFTQALAGVADSFLNESDKIAFNARILMDALAAVPDTSSKPVPDLKHAANSILHYIDTVDGGIGGAPKFPSLPAISLLWQAYLKTGADRYKNAVVFSLQRMCQGGLYDHIGGGFHRYCVDKEWLVPHFEKMLSDNALFTGLLAEVAAVTKNLLFRTRLFETVEFMMRDMMKDGAFISSIDADSGDGEGAFYVWTAAEIDTVLGQDAAFFKQVYGVFQGGNWTETVDGGNIPNRLLRAEMLDDKDEKTLEACRKKLKTVRDRRPMPAKDEKILTDANAMAVSALVRAGVLFARPDWIDHAKNIFATVLALSGNGPLLQHACPSRQNACVLEDYAAMTEASLCLYGATGDRRFLDHAEAFAKTVLAGFSDEKGGFYAVPADAADVVVRQKKLHDLPGPCGNSLMIGNLDRLYSLTQNKLYKEASQKTVAAFRGTFAEHLLFSSAAITAAEGLVTVKIRPDNLDWLEGVTAPNLAIEPHDRSVADVCAGARCLPSVHSKPALAALFDELRQNPLASNDD